MGRLPKHKLVKAQAYSRAAGRAQRPRRSFWKWLNGPHQITSGRFDPHASRKLIAGMLGGFLIFVAFSSLFYHQSLVPNAHADYFVGWSHSRNIIFSDTGPTSSRYQFNSTCVSVVGGTHFQFDFSVGVAGTGGKNCNSADILMGKAPMNLQTVSGRQLEAAMGWLDSTQAETAGIINRMYFWLRTNGTLPGFNENYDPTTDKQVRLFWESCRFNNCAATSLNQSGVYVVHDSSKSLNLEGNVNDQVIVGNLPNLGTGGAQWEQDMVLNFTGSTDQIDIARAGFQAATIGGISSSLQQGQDYFFGMQVVWNAPAAPCASCIARSEFNIQIGSPQLPSTFQVWSVPAGCDDPANKAQCSVGTVTPTFSIDPLDPSTWGNAIIKGMLWVFTTAGALIIAGGVALFNILSPIGSTIGNLAASGLASLINIFYGVIKGIMNTVGNTLGLGNLGDNFFNFLSDVASFFSSVFGSIIGGIAGTVTAAANAISALGNTLTTYYTDLTAWLGSLADILGLFWSTFAPMVNITANFSVSLWILYGAFRFSLSLEGGKRHWFDPTKQFLFLGFSISVWLAAFIITHVIIPIGHMVTSFSTTLGARPKIEVAGTSTP